MAPIKYNMMSKAKAYIAIGDMKTQIEARGLDSTSTMAINHAINILFDITGTLSRRTEAALDFTSCAKKLLDLHANFKYDNSSRQVIYTIPGEETNYRVLNGQLWDDIGVQTASSTTSTSPLKGSASPFLPAINPGGTPSPTAPAISATPVQPNTPAKDPLFPAEWPSPAYAFVFPSGPDPTTLPIPSFYKKRPKSSSVSSSSPVSKFRVLISSRSSQLPPDQKESGSWLHLKLESTAKLTRVTRRTANPLQIPRGAAHHLQSITPWTS